MRIAFLNPTGVLGGAELSLLDIIASFRLQPDVWDLHLILGQDGPLAERARDQEVTVTVLPFPENLAQAGDAGDSGGRLKSTAKLARAGISAISYGRELRRALQTITPEVIHTNGFKMHILGARNAAAGTPVIWNVRDFPSSRPVMARLLKGFLHRAAMIVTNSASVAADVRTVCGETVRVETIYNAIDLQEFSPDGDRLDLDQLAGLPPAAAGTIRVGLPGTLAHWKGHEVFLRALKLLPNDLAVRGYIIGGALYQTVGSQYQIEDLRRLAVEIGLDANRIGFTGYLDRPAAALRTLDIVVHASTQPEPFGRVVAEALACGRAVVASRAGGVTEIITEGVDALGHEPGDAAELAERIEALARDPALRERLGHAGRHTAERRFDRTRLAAEWAGVYQKATGSR
ncbi:MAG: glycosyltransferase family 4 protein [Pyrinomonadaceae bacterium]